MEPTERKNRAKLQFFFDMTKYFEYFFHFFSRARYYWYKTHDFRKKRKFGSRFSCKRGAVSPKLGR